MFKYVIPIISILVAILSDDIDRRFNGNTQIKKVLLVCSCGAILIHTIPLIASIIF